MIKPEVLDAMVAAGCTAEQIAAAVKADQSSSSGAARQARYRARQSGIVTSDVTRVTAPSQPSQKEGFPHTPSEENPPLKEKPPKGVKKKVGSRIPDDFQPDIEWAVSQGLSRQQAEMQASRFRDYWTAKPGKDGIKADWPATWRNWIRSHLERSGADAQPSQPVNWTTRLNHARRTNQWPAAQWGPPPGSPGCRAPPDLLQDGDGVGWIEWKQVA